MDSTRSMPIFVLGCERSGTTLLRMILDSHSNIACPPESSFLVKLAAVYEVDRCVDSITHMGFTIEDILEQMRVFTTHFFEGYAASKGKGRWADKTTQYVNHMSTIDAMFRGNVQYIGIVRHGLDVAHQLCKFDWGILDPYVRSGVERPIGCIRFWSDQNMKLLDFMDKVGDRFHLIRYEELTTRPEEVMQSVLEFLGESWEPDILKYYEFEHDQGYGDTDVKSYRSIKSNYGEYREWPTDLQVRLYLECYEMMGKLGYSINIPRVGDALIDSI